MTDSSMTAHPDMREPMRWGIFCPVDGMLVPLELEESGPYVLYTDHAATVAKLARVEALAELWEQEASRGQDAHRPLQPTPRRPKGHDPMTPAPEKLPALLAKLRDQLDRGKASNPHAPLFCVKVSEMEVVVSALEGMRAEAAPLAEDLLPALVAPGAETCERPVFPMTTHPSTRVSMTYAQYVKATLAAPLAEGREGWMRCTNCRVSFRQAEAAARCCPVCKAGDQYTYDGAGADYTRVFKDGTAWCATHPDFVNLQESPAGFGDTAYAATFNLYATPAAQRVAAGDVDHGMSCADMEVAFDSQQAVIQQQKSRIERLESLLFEEQNKPRDALAASPPRGAVAIVGERGSVSWRSDHILPVGTKLYTHPAAQADARGIVIDDAMIERATETWYTLPMQTKDADRFRIVLSAALAAPVAVGGA
jgi:hypothetical protein